MKYFIFISITVIPSFPYDFFFDSIVKSILLDFYIFVNFSVLLLLLISSFISLRSEKTLCMISVFLNLLRHFVAKIQSVLEKGPCALKKKV